MPFARSARALLVPVLIASLAVPLAAGAQTRSRVSDEAVLAAAGTALVGAVLLDRAIDGAVPSGGGTRLEWASDALNHGGRPQYALAALGATWAGARLAGSPRTASAAEHVVVALLASGVANGTLKYTVGRERPSETDDPGTFAPFSRENRWQSFPSGHAVVAFSLASSVSEEAGRPWVTGLAYGTAALVGWSRIYDDKHWASDVVGGALVGIATSRATLHFLHRRRAHDADDDAPGDGVRVALLPNGLMVSIAR